MQPGAETQSRPAVGAPTRHRRHGGVPFVQDRTHHQRAIPDSLVGLLPTCSTSIVVVNAAKASSIRPDAIVASHPGEVVQYLTARARHEDTEMTTITTRAIAAAITVGAGHSQKVVEIATGINYGRTRAAHRAGLARSASAETGGATKDIGVTMSTVDPPEVFDLLGRPRAPWGAPSAGALT